MTRTKKKLILVTVLWLFFLLSIGDMPLRALAFISVGVGAMTAAILAL